MNFRFCNDRPIYIQLVEQLEIYIVSGSIEPGSRLPSVRELAASCEVNPNTMQKALSELENLHLIYTERTNGKFVTTDKKTIRKRKEKYAETKALSFFESMAELGFSSDEAIEYLKERREKNEITRN